ncbi:MAG: hypothetical protein Q8N47_17170 [Bryobacterales bacterium]|nr:hypothetical protein [Bryobacterales bacterium]
MTGARITLAACLLLVWCDARAAERPKVFEGGVVSAATLRPPDQPGGGVALGSIATVFGASLAAQTAQAASVPLPRELAGTSVLVNGAAVPLFYVSPGQINFQVPMAPAAPQGSSGSALVVRTAAGSSDPVPLPTRLASPGIFTLDGSGCGHAAILNYHEGGAVSLNGPDQPARPGGFIRIWATGAGEPYTTPWPPDGMPPQTSESARVFAGATAGDRSAGVTWAGKAFGMVGVDQIDVQLSADVLEGCAIPVRIWRYYPYEPSVSSQPVPLSIASAGDTCVDKPRSYAQLEWVHRESSGVAPAPPSDSLEVSFSAALWMRPVPPAAAAQCKCADQWKTPSGPSCGGFDSYERLTQLDAGPLTVSPAGMRAETFRPEGSANGPVYRVPLPAGAVRQGQYAVSSGGGAEVGAFLTSVSIPEPIRLTTSFPPGTVLPYNGFVEITWTGGAPDALVRARFTSRTAERDRVCECVSSTKWGWMGFSSSAPSGPRTVGQLRSDDAEIEISVVPSSETGFEAAGLTLGGRHTWSYRSLFGGLKVK